MRCKKHNDRATDQCWKSCQTEDWGTKHKTKLWISWSYTASQADLRRESERYQKFAEIEPKEDVYQRNTTCFTTFIGCGCINGNTNPKWTPQTVGDKPGLELLKREAGSKLTQPGVSAAPTRHSLLVGFSQGKCGLRSPNTGLIFFLFHPTGPFFQRVQRKNGTLGTQVKQLQRNT